MPARRRPGPRPGGRAPAGCGPAPSPRSTPGTAAAAQRALGGSSRWPLRARPSHPARGRAGSSPRRGRDRGRGLGGSRVPPGRARHTRRRYASRRTAVRASPSKAASTGRPRRGCPWHRDTCRRRWDRRGDRPVPAIASARGESAGRAGRRRSGAACPGRGRARDQRAAVSRRPRGASAAIHSRPIAAGAHRWRDTTAARPPPLRAASRGWRQSAGRPASGPTAGCRRSTRRRGAAPNACALCRVPLRRTRARRSPRRCGAGAPW